MGNLHKGIHMPQPVSSYISGFWYANQDSVPKIRLQQDTIPKVPAQTDTIIDAPEGINPLFLLIERKTAEVEAIKASNVAKAQLVRRPRPKPKQVDTTCYICPQGQPQSFASVYKMAESKNLNQLTTPYLYDADYYSKHVEVNQQVFIETQPPQNHSKPVSIHIKPFEQEQGQVSWLFYPVFSLLVLLVFIKVFFAKSLKEVFTSALTYYNAKKMLWDSSSVLNNLLRLLDISYFLSIPVAVIIVLNVLNINVIMVSPLYIGVYTFIGLLLLRLFRFLSIQLVGYVSNLSEQLKHFYTNQLLYLRVLGVLLIPLNIFALYTFDIFKLIFAYVIVVLIAIVILLRLVRIVQVFISNQFSMFYLFLYLCALEFIPLLLVFKEFFEE